MKINIAILISTYNGEKYIDSQVQSILNQEFDHAKYQVKLYLRDDGSTDGTKSIIKKIQSENSCVVTLPETENEGFAKSFLTLLEYASADYYLFSDQDDVWVPNKLSRFMETFIHYTVDESAPIAVFSDAWVADKDAVSVGRRVLGNRTQRIVGDHLLFNQQLFESFVQGASLGINANVKERFLLYDFDKISFDESHDHFLGLIASSFGQLIYLDEPLINYRQTGSNEVGARAINQGVTAKLVNLQNRIKETSYLMLSGELVLSRNPLKSSEYLELRKVNRSRTGSLTRLRFFWKNRELLSLRFPKRMAIVYTLLMRPTYLNNTSRNGCSKP
ncbi:glycosyltransferase family 2 protein [Lacticaseibacillus rhamnosus]|uniref:glycosyltransferase family 2 protein n=1 Tax=Lacticaseibacillus rhamnosus TaxID=47715 RepID=UPI0007DED3C5|nr:glycosyltransferase family 2 protein [Lacticaseibacillus rhamnosus]AQG72503.1 hypothetical protein AWJ15_05685 [Lacticaseibacillus rhamnosus]OAU08537.1 hypothetical protein PY76_13725 [Lacticaseibacillus rhamnosus]OAU18754.1 hypothetical protein PY77_11915 [Lacticaseibacillus rhamnosus]OAU73958.1 hypothetical protein PY62_15020 [Lacticaseibacillus rhamnosus]